MTGRRDLTGRTVAERYPEVAAMWHPDNPLGPDEVTYGSNLKVAFRGCPRDPRHVWTATVKAITLLGQGCSVCKGSQVMAGINDLESLRPELAAEWDFESNELMPSQVSVRSGKDVAWTHVIRVSITAGGPPSTTAARVKAALSAPVSECNAA